MGASRTELRWLYLAAPIHARGGSPVFIVAKEECEARRKGARWYGHYAFDLRLQPYPVLRKAGPHGTASRGA